MRVTIVGGGLQGVELCWLAQKAGWGTLLVDERPAPPALRLADVFAQCDVTKLGGSGVLTRKVEHQILGTDIVIPALENAAALAAQVGEKYPDCDVDFHFGGQPVYYYIISLE